MQATDPCCLSEGLFGLHHSDPTLVPYKDIAAVVSNTPIIHFDRFDEKELSQFIAIHDQVNVSLMKNFTVIPMRFGIVAESTEEISHILAKAYVQFKAALERVIGNAEFIVQVFLNEGNVLQKLMRENTEIQQCKKEVESKSKILGFPSKIKLGKAIFEAMESYKKECSKNVLGDLADHFPNYSAGKLLDKELLLNYSFLIGVKEESALAFQLNTLADTYKDELRFKYIGPMVPYSFAAINLRMGNFDVVDEARKIFGFGESVAYSEIKNTYYKLAREYHPDKYAFTENQVLVEEAESKMKVLTGANEILTVYCQQFLATFPPEKEQLCSFRKEDVEQLMTIEN